MTVGHRHHGKTRVLRPSLRSHAHHLDAAPIRLGESASWPVDPALGGSFALSQTDLITDKRLT